MLELTRKICAAHGVSGYEKKAADVIRAEIEKYTDENYTDNLGNLIAVKKGSGNGKKIMLPVCSHWEQLNIINRQKSKGNHNFK